MAKGKHRRERGVEDLRRRKPTRPPYPRVLIVCEGQKTEPQYFDEIRVLNRVPTAHIHILQAPGTQPRQVVDAAVDIFNATKAYEHVFAVFDRDDHTTYADALTRAGQLATALRNDEDEAVAFAAIPSVPCFELWFLLHFADIKAYFHRDEVFRRLRAQVPGYAKGLKGMYAKTEPNFATAAQRAAALQKQSNPFAGNEAYTNADAVVTLLRGIRVVR